MEVVLPRETLHVFGLSLLWEGACYFRWRVRNYGLAPTDLRLGLAFAADYADIFEVRGIERLRRGRPLSPSVGRDTVVLGYEGLDGVTRRTRLAFSESPAELNASYALFRRRIGAHEEQSFELTVSFETGASRARVFLDDALTLAEERLHGQERCCAGISTSNARFDEWVHRSAADLRMMLTETPHGLYPYAGIPWFSTVFGRDGIFTALEMLWMDPSPARGVLSFLAATQADELDPDKDAEPGKILHELRGGEMAALDEVPFGRYYGTVDATPLFIVLAGAYYERTGDLDLIESIWPNIERALAWIDEFGDQDGDGFVEYVRRSETGLTTQGWKDSVDSIFHADGRLAEPPVALCEVQGYVYAARQAAAALARRLGGRESLAEEQERRAQELRERFEELFWCEEIATYALALDGAKRPCRVITSNPGHCLFTGIASPERARKVAAALMSATSFSGWGIRTLDASEKRYNPMSYHNGSIWPHDNAVIAHGMARYGLKNAAARVLSGLYDASLHMDLQRMPELFCGFHRRSHEGPTRYPVACSPQAWAAGSVFLLLQSCLGLEIDAPRRQIRFSHPELPPCLETVTIRDLQVAGARVDLQIKRYPRDVGVSVDRKEGEVEVIVVK